MWPQGRPFSLHCKPSQNTQYACQLMATDGYWWYVKLPISGLPTSCFNFDYTNIRLCPKDARIDIIVLLDAPQEQLYATYPPICILLIVTSKKRQPNEQEQKWNEVIVSNAIRCVIINKKFQWVLLCAVGLKGRLSFRLTASAIPIRVKWSRGDSPRWTLEGGSNFSRGCDNSDTRRYRYFLGHHNITTNWR